MVSKDVACVTEKIAVTEMYQLNVWLLFLSMLPSSYVAGLLFAAVHDAVRVLCHEVCKIIVANCQSSHD